MKTRYIALLGTIPVWALQVCHPQGFINLDFEQATLSPIPPGQYGSQVPIAKGLPGWSGYLGANAATQVLQNNATLGDASIDIVGPSWTDWIISGHYTAMLQPGIAPGTAGGGPYINASISQTGLVPPTAKSIQLQQSGSVPFTVSIAGQYLALVPLGGGTGVSLDYARYGADIIPFAGQTVTLTITALAGYATPATPDWFDGIGFSPQAIPEPTVLSLVSIYALLSCGRHKQLTHGISAH